MAPGGALPGESRPPVWPTLRCDFQGHDPLSGQGSGEGPERPLVCPSDPPVAYQLLMAPRS